VREALDALEKEVGIGRFGPGFGVSRFIIFDILKNSKCYHRLALLVSNSEIKCLNISLFIKLSQTMIDYLLVEDLTT